MSKAEPTVTNNPDGSITESYKLSEMNSEQLVTLLQGTNRQREKLRDDAKTLQGLLAQRLKQERHAAALKQLEEMEAGISGQAPGVTFEALAAAKT